MPESSPPKPGLLSFLVLVVAIVAVIWLQIWLSAKSVRVAPFSELEALIESGKVTEVEIREDDVRAFTRPGPDQRGASIVQSSRIPGHDPGELIELLARKRVPYRGVIESTAWSLTSWILPSLLMIGLWSLTLRRVAGGRGGPMSFGRSKMKLYERTETDRVTFADVAGVDEAESELIEVVDFLKHPQKYRALGARIPKGVLLLGPPGTGKTLLARAVAGEAGVAFFSISGSEFVEMFVGVGAARVRDLFEQAKQRAPCIVFVDELDAIGKSRGGLATMSSNDEREQTLNQLLVEMDGFDGSTAVVIMAATNRPEILDPALVRAGRFDRQVLVDRPDLRGRRDILGVHARKVVLGADVKLDVIAQRTSGMVGADLANLINEAALGAARRGANEVLQADLEEAIDRIQLGVKKKNRVMDEAEKRRVAFHESGHALVASSLSHADPVHRVTIIPRSVGSLGATLQVPSQDRFLLTQEQLRDRLCVLMAGRAAEEIAFASISTGAQNDLEQATDMAQQMVCRYGMSARLGPRAIGRRVALRFLDAPLAGGDERDFSEETARAVDEEVRTILDTEYGRAQRILRDNEPVLRRIAGRLLDVETLDAPELRLLLGTDVPTGPLAAPQLAACS